LHPAPLAERLRKACARDRWGKYSVIKGKPAVQF